MQHFVVHILAELQCCEARICGKEQEEQEDTYAKEVNNMLPGRMAVGLHTCKGETDTHAVLLEVESQVASRCWIDAGRKASNSLLAVPNSQMYDAVLVVSGRRRTRSELENSCGFDR